MASAFDTTSKTADLKINTRVIQKVISHYLFKFCYSTQGTSFWGRKCSLGLLGDTVKIGRVLLNSEQALV